MFKAINTSYTGADASLEIFIMLSVAFALGFLLRFILGKKRTRELEGEISRLQKVEKALREAKERAKKKLDYMKGLEREYQRELELERERVPEVEEEIVSMLRNSV